MNEKGSDSAEGALEPEQMTGDEELGIAMLILASERRWQELDALISHEMQQRTDNPAADLSLRSEN